MITYAMSLSALGAHLHEKEADALRNFAMKNVEILENPLRLDKEEVRNSLDLTFQLIREDAICPASIHLPFWDPSALEEEVRMRESECLAQTIRYYFDHGIRVRNMTLHGSLEPSLSEHPQRLKQSRKTLQELLVLAQEYDFSLNVEFLPRTCLGNSVEELKELVRDTDPEHLGICFDVNHVMNRYKELPEMIGELAPRIRSFHLSDYDGFDECHWFPGQGIIDWCAVMDAIRKIDHDVLLILETSPQLRRVMGSRELVPEFLVKENETAVWFLENCGQLQSQRNDFVRNWKK